MKIVAVRVAEVGCFSRPVALENFGAGLNVLTGANEAGKSTILAALRMAFEREHKTAHRSVEALRPYSGGTPLVEVDFIIAGETWRLRKRYLAGKMAELRNLSTGHVARGADAEDLLLRLLDEAGGNASFSLLWAAQKDALTPEPPDAKLTTGLKRAISSEIAVTVGGTEARRTRGVVRTELETFVTAARGQPRGEYEAAVKQHKRAVGDLDLARGRRDAALARLDRLAAIKSREADLSDPAVHDARTSAAKSASLAAATAREAQQRQRAAADAVSAAESRLELARAHRDGLQQDLQRLATLTSEIALDQDAAREHASAVADTETRVSEARAARDVERNALILAERELKSAIAAERRHDAQQRLDDLTAILAAIDEATSAGLALKAAIEAIRVTPALLRAIRDEEQAIARIQDRLSAAAPKVTIAYAPGAEGRISAAGQSLASGAHLVDRPLVLTIDGIGTIEIAPGVSQDAAGMRDALNTHVAQRDRLLADAGVADAAEAESRIAQRQELEVAIGEARARLAALTPPGGLAKLKSDMASLQASASAEIDESVRARTDIEAEIEQLRASLRETEPAFETAQRDATKTREAAARHAASGADRLQRVAELEHKLPPPPQRPALEQKLQSDVAGYESALHAAVREHTAWRETAPDAAQLRALEAEAERAETALRTGERELEDVRRSIASLEGELRADRNDEVEARVAELEGALASATAQLARISDEVAALQLLDSELRAEEMRSQDQYMAPISQRLGPIAAQVLEGDIAMAENFAPAGLLRHGEREAIAALSGGTQEQLAVMVRLAFGRLMADRGTPVPVILDDALVYSDDERILRMFMAMIKAAEHHQLIVLTCRSRAFAGLDGHRLKLEDWQPDAVAVPRPLLATG